MPCPLRLRGEGSHLAFVLLLYALYPTRREMQHKLQQKEELHGSHLKHITSLCAKQACLLQDEERLLQGKRSHQQHMYSRVCSGPMTSLSSLAWQSGAALQTGLGSSSARAAVPGRAFADCQTLPSNSLIGVA